MFPFDDIISEILVQTRGLQMERQTDISNPHMHTPRPLTHSGLVAPYGDRDLGHHWLR